MYHCSNPKTLPLIAAGPLNFATCHWATSLIYKAYKKGLVEDDLYDTPWRDTAGYNSQRYVSYYLYIIVHTNLFLLYTRGAHTSGSYLF